MNAKRRSSRSAQGLARAVLEAGNQAFNADPDAVPRDLLAAHLYGLAAVVATLDPSGTAGVLDLALRQLSETVLGLRTSAPELALDVPVGRA